MNRINTILIAWCLFCVQQALAQYERKTNLPTVYIETFDGNGIFSKEVYEYCRLHYIDETGQVTSYDSVSIRGRGNSTWNLSKKPYKIKFLSKEKFLGKGYAKAKKWTLMANAGDKTMIRNALTSELGAFTSLKFNPAAKFVDMVLNNVYVGTYQISDQIDVRPHRVDITEQPYPLEDTTNISGGYLLEVDGFKDGNYFTTNYYKAPVRIHHPDDEEIVAKQTTYIRNFINNQFEKALNSTDFTNPVIGYRAFVDSTSLIDWYICTEVSANIDGFFSTYFYKERDNDRLFWGPLWDYDIAYNNDHRVQNDMRLQSSVNSLMIDIAYSGSKDWVNRMWEDPWFQTAVYNRYKELLDSGLVDYMQEKVDSLSKLLEQSQQLNYQRWGINRKMYHEVVIYSSYNQYVSDLKSFITDHCKFLENAFYERKPSEPTPPFELKDFYYRFVNAKTRKAMDADGDKIVQYTNTDNRLSQDWMIRRSGDHYMLINRASGLALNDPTYGAATATTNVGTQLNAVMPDDHSEAQMWDFIPQGSEGYYNLLNVHTQHIANLNGGSTSDYTAILSYTNDSKNSTSTNRLWFIEQSSSLPYEISGITYHQEPEDYALAYNPQTMTLHFGSETPALLTFPVRVYSADGRLIGTFRADGEFPLSMHPSGIYIATWNVSGKTRSAKFRR